MLPGASVVGAGSVRRAKILSTLVVLLSIASFPTSAQAEVGAQASIVGGEPVASGALPFLAFIIGGEGEETGACTGSLISPTLVLTAAHCLLNEEGTAYKSPESFGVFVGITNLSEAAGHGSAVTRIAVDPNYRSIEGFPVSHDAGLIELSSPAAQAPVAVATSEIWRGGNNALQVGWGDTYAGQPELTEELLMASTVVQSKRFCQNRYGASFHPSAELCTLDYPSYASTTCQGDSGGPLLVVRDHQWIVIGVTSFGIAGCPTNQPIIYTRADAEASWIQAEMGEEKPRLPLLTTTEAKHNTFTVLRTEGRLRNKFSGHGGYRVSCRRNTRTAVVCYPSWWKGPNDYWGKVVINLGWEGYEVNWFYRYEIKSVNDWCWWHSGHRGRCTIRSVRS